MKKLLIDSSGYQTYLEIRPIEAPSHQGWNNLRITTMWTNGSGTTEEHVKFEANLDAESFQQLKTALKDL